MSTATRAAPGHLLPHVQVDSLDIVQHDKFCGGQATLHVVGWDGRICLFKEYDSPGTVTAEHLHRVHQWTSSSPVDRLLATPLAIVQDADGTVVGFLQPLAPDRYLDAGSSRPLSMLGSDEAGYSEGQRLAVLGALLELILELHRGGIVVGDLKLSNTLITSPVSSEDPVFMVDCDSFSFADHPLSAQPYTDHMLPPHCHGQPMTRHTDLYQFALLVEKTLTGEYSLSPDTGPLPPAVAGSMRDWHYDILNHWKSLEPDPARTVTYGDAMAMAREWRQLWTQQRVSSLRGTQSRTATQSPAPAVQAAWPTRGAARAKRGTVPYPGSYPASAPDRRAPVSVPGLSQRLSAGWWKGMVTVLAVLGVLMGAATLVTQAVLWSAPEILYGSVNIFTVVQYFGSYMGLSSAGDDGYNLITGMAGGTPMDPGTRAAPLLLLLGMLALGAVSLRILWRRRRTGRTSMGLVVAGGLLAAVVLGASIWDAVYWFESPLMASLVPLRLPSGEGWWAPHLAWQVQTVALLGWILLGAGVGVATARQRRAA